MPIQGKNMRDSSKVEPRKDACVCHVAGFFLAKWSKLTFHRWRPRMKMPRGQRCHGTWDGRPAAPTARSNGLARDALGLEAMELCNLCIEYTFYYGERAIKQIWMRFLFLNLLGSMQGGSQIQPAGSGVVDAPPHRTLVKYPTSPILESRAKDSGEKVGEATADPFLGGEENVVEPDRSAEPLSAEEEEAANFGEISSPIDETQELDFANEERPVQTVYASVAVGLKRVGRCFVRGRRSIWHLCGRPTFLR
eukprot:Skav221547  [mRNA]  locus=scaffold1376:6355:16554:- [translate_table: standard]